MYTYITTWQHWIYIYIYVVHSSNKFIDRLKIAKVKQTFKILVRYLRRFIKIFKIEVNNQLNLYNLWNGKSKLSEKYVKNV